jgi:hypothetical protein
MGFFQASISLDCWFSGVPNEAIGNTEELLAASPGELSDAVALNEL